MYRSVNVGFWTDTKVLDEFTPEDKYFYLYLFTNPHTNLAGCYEISIKQVVTETGYSRETVENLIKRFIEVHDVIRYEPKTKEILILKWGKHNWTTSDKYRKALGKQIKAVKCSNFKAFLTSLFEGNEDIDTVSIGYQYPMDTTITNTITNTISNTNKKSSKKPAEKIPPAIDDVRAYIQEKGYNVDADRFMDYYEAQGWKLSNGNKMKNWQAAVRNWHQRQQGNSKRKNGFLDILEKGDY